MAYSIVVPVEQMKASVVVAFSSEARTVEPLLMSLSEHHYTVRLEIHEGILE